MSRSGLETLPNVQEALPKVWEWSRYPPKSAGRLPRCPGVVKRPFGMFESGREARPNVRKWSGDPPGCPGVVRRPSWMSGSGRKALPDVLEWSGGPPTCPGMVGKPS